MSYLALYGELILTLTALSFFKSMMAHLLIEIERLCPLIERV